MNFVEYVSISALYLSMQLKKLLNIYEIICNEVARRFAKKQKVDISYWVCDEVGGVLCLGDMYFFSFSDVYYDMLTRQPKGNILKWQ